ncbi:DUF4439 domain-containing protein [Cellulomonas hominis]
MNETRSCTAPGSPGAPGSSPARGRGAVAVVLALVAALVLSGCGLRLETDPPGEPVPDATETARRLAVDDALALSAAATSAAQGAPASVAAALAGLADFSAQHVAALGGVYDSGLDSAADGDPAGTSTPDTSTAGTTATGPVAPTDVLVLLATSAGDATRDADAVADGPLARLLASVATARAQSLAELAVALGVEAPEIAPAAAPTAPTATTAPTASTGTPAADPTAGLDAATLTGLVSAEDQVGYGLEVVAAQLSDAARATAVAAAARHRDAARAWAVAAGLAGTAADPRRTSYALPAGVVDPTVAATLARTLHTTLADTYAAAVAQASAGQRAPLVTALRSAALDAQVWGATAVAFPGLPEQAPAA